MRHLFGIVTFTKVIFLLLFQLSTVIAALPEAVLAEPFTHQRFGFSLEVPAGFEAVTDPIPNVGVVVKSSSKKYPSFNVLVLPAHYDTNQAEDEQTRKLIDDYTKVGIIKPQALSTKKTVCAGRPAFNAEIKYALDTDLLVSSVTIVSAIDRHFIITFVGEEQGWENSAALREEIVGGFKILEVQPSKANNGHEEDINKYSPYLIILFLVIIVAVIYIIRLSAKD